MFPINYKMSTTVLFRILFLWALSSTVVSAQTAPPAPSEYEGLYSTMQASINSFNQNTLALWDGSKYPVTFSGHLATLNSNSGATILTPNAYQAFLIELNGLKALGVTGVVINIDYPILDPNFDALGGQSADYLDLYKRAIADIRTKGLKVIIETGGIFSDPLFSSVDVTAYYQSLSTTDYMNGRAQQALVIAQQLQPDYLNVLAEPDTEAAQTGKPEIYTYNGSIQLLNTILGVLRGAYTTVPLGAGVGTWMATDSQGKGVFDYVNAYAATSVDSIDMHVYPVNRDYLSRMNTIASIAKGAGKKITMTEAWAHKVSDDELGVLSMDVVFARDVYSFWAPLDTQFLQAMVNFSHYQHLDLMAAFWTGYFRAYLDWDDTTCCLPPADLYDLVQPLQTQQKQVGGYTSTGYAWDNFMVDPPDTTPPDQPVLTAPNIYPNALSLSWTWPNDNVGVARFTVVRDGSLLATTANTAYYDTGLSDGKQYNYTVTAWDAGNNSTASSTLSVTTKDNTPPTPPAVLTAEGASNTSITVTWSGDTDNVKVTGYKIYRGLNGATPIPWAAVDASPYTNTGLQSNATYCYYILSQDAVGFVSDPSATACFTTPDTLAPSVPKSVTAAGTAPPQAAVSWSASTDGIAVAGYNIQRKLNTGAWSVIASGITSTSFVDSTAVLSPDTMTPSTSVKDPVAGASVKGTITFSAVVTDIGSTSTYSYQVNAYDAAGNTSVWSVPGSLSWAKNISGIAGVRFLVDGVDAAPETTVSPYYIAWNTNTVSNGSHTLTVIARDNAGNIATSAPVVVTVGNFDTTPPTVPTAVSAAGVAAPQATVAWTASTDAKGVTGYNIQRKLNTGAWSVIASGITSTSFVDSTAVLSPDTMAPSTSVKDPVAGASVKGTVTFSAVVTDIGSTSTYSYQVNAYDAAGNTSVWSAPGNLSWAKSISGIAGVRFLVDGVDAAPETTVSPYYIAWNTNTVSNGSHTLTVIARDNAGNIATSAPVVVTVGNFDTTPPTVPAGLLAAGTAPQPITLGWNASIDAVGVTGYNIQRKLSGGTYTTLASGLTAPGFIDGAAVLQPDVSAPSASVAAPTAGSTATGIVTFSASVYDIGTKTIYVYQVNAVDAAGNTSAWSAPGSVTWGTNMSGIAGVRFLVDGVDAGPEVSLAPYYVRWNTTTALNGSHTLTVIARDNAGNTTTSAPVVITVSN